MPQLKSGVVAQMGPPAHVSVRARVADMTRDAHEALHHHPVLERLTAADIQLPEYRDILCRYLAFYEAAEQARERFSVLSALSLRPEIELLKLDVPDARPSEAPDLSMTSQHEVLGLMYVLYGARFGGRLIYRALRAARPNDAHHFFSKPSAPEDWRFLLNAMEDVWPDGAGVAAVENGATKAFEQFGLAMSAGGMPPRQH